MIFSLLKRRRELIVAEADEFMEAYGNNAYWKARAEAHDARKRGDHARDKFLSKVCVEIAKHTDFEIGLDTATRYLDDKQTQYDPGPGLAINRPPGTTIH